MDFIRRIPIPTSALALGVAALGNLLLPYSPVIRLICGAVAAVVALLVIARIVLDREEVRAELSTPAALAVLPALFMALMVLATYLKPFAAAPARGLWIAALVLQVATTVLFVVRHVGSFKIGQVLPSWFLVFVGFVVASVTSPAFDAVPVGRVLLLAGAVGYAAALPVIVYRLVKHGALPEPALPTLAIFAAPPSLLLVGYLAVTEAKQASIVYALLAVAGVSLLFVLTRLPRVLMNRFCPACAALTFPVVISAIALKQSNAFLAAGATGSFIPAVVVTAMDLFAAALVLYVLARYAMLVATPAPSKAAA